MWLSRPLTEKAVYGGPSDLGGPQGPIIGRVCLRSTARAARGTLGRSKVQAAAH